MHSLFERISHFLFDLCHFISAFDGERVSVGFHIVEEHESLVEQLISCRLPHGISLVVIEFSQHIHLHESSFLVGNTSHRLHHILDGSDTVEGIRPHVLVVEFLDFLTSHLHLLLFEHSFECCHKHADQPLDIISL